MKLYTRMNMHTMFLLPAIAICIDGDSLALEIGFLGFAIGVSNG